MLLGLEASISDVDDNVITLKDAKVVVESRDENKIQVKLLTLTFYRQNHIFLC